MKKVKDVYLKSTSVYGAVRWTAGWIFSKNRLQFGKIMMLVVCLLFSMQTVTAGESELQIRTSAAGGIVSVERILDDSRMLISVSDAAKKPLFGLTAKDFVVTDARRTARIVSVQPLAESLEVPRHIVLVLDNSDSMRQRNAIEPLLAGVDELLKIIRPIDEMQIVVFSKDDDKIQMGGRTLRVKIFTSNKPSELKKFVANVYRDGITSTTVLHEGMLAGIELIKTHPANEPRFMVVFSDGEDLNSTYKSDEVLKAVEGLDKFRAYGIDYMPVQAKDPFLTAFAEGNNGEIWKAASDTNLVPIFQSVASKMQYYYVVSYLFPTTGSLAVAPASLMIDDILDFDAAAVATPIKSRIDASALKLSPVLDTAYDIASWKLSLVNNDGAMAVKAGEGMPGSEIMVPLKTDDLAKLAAGGDIKATMEVQDRKGQTLLLSAPPVKVNYFKTTGTLAVSPATLTIDDIVDFNAAAAVATSVKSRIDASAVTLRPVVNAAHEVATWKLALANNNGTLSVQTGEGMPGSEIMVPLKTDDLAKLASGGDIKATMEVQDRKGQTLVLKAMPVKVNHFKTTGSLAVSPATVTIEEIKTIDSSPMLGYIYFADGSNEIPTHYVRLAGAAETAAFDGQRFRDTMEKHYQMLNIIGKRMTEHPEASITLTGCNANIGPEKGNRKLSTARAEAVRDYLQSVWNVAPERILIKARNLPEIPSTSRLEEGRAENRRVEIRSDMPAILAPVRSTYLATRIDTAALTFRPVVTAAHGVARWTAAAANSRMILGEVAGDGNPPAEVSIPLKTIDLNEMAAAGDIRVSMAVQDRKGQDLSMAALPVKVDFIQTSQRMAQKQDFRIQEKYALILFDFDSDVISARNKEIVNAISARIKELPKAKTEIVGHTDTIGTEDYNIKLSERRALAAYKLLSSAYGETPGEQISHRGVGPNNPLYDNLTPEARAFNRTVTITLEYMAKE